MLRADEVNKEVQHIEANFHNWLQMSGISCKEFLECRNMTNFQVANSYIDGYNAVAVGSIINGQFVQMGEQFCYCQGDLNAFQDLSLLLLYIAERLDSANKSDSDSLQKKDYFFNQVKDFIKMQEDYRKMN